MNLAKFRESKGVTQQELADKIMLTRQMISAIENGAKPSVDTAKKIARILEFDWTLFFENNQQPDRPAS